MQIFVSTFLGFSIICALAAVLFLTYMLIQFIHWYALLIIPSLVICYFIGKAAL